MLVVRFRPNASETRRGECTCTLLLAKFKQRQFKKPFRRRILCGLKKGASALCWGYLLTALFGAQCLQYASVGGCLTDSVRPTVARLGERTSLALACMLACLPSCLPACLPASRRHFLARQAGKRAQSTARTVTQAQKRQRQQSRELASENDRQERERERER